jgi:hypothetical protein
MGKAKLHRQGLTNLESISVYDCLTLFRVPLDIYSPAETGG